MKTSNLVHSIASVAGFTLFERSVSVLSGVIFARLLGVEQYGYYVFALSVVLLLSIPARIGLPQLLSREIARFHSTRNYSSMKGVRSWSLRSCFVSTSAVIALLGIPLLVSVDSIAALDLYALTFGLILLPFMVLQLLLSGVLRGLRHVRTSVWPVAVLKPIVVLLVIAFLWMIGHEIVAATAVFVTTFGFLVACLILYYAMLKVWPAATSSVSPKYDQVYWRKAAVAFVALSSLHFLSAKTDILMLGTLGSASDVGVYNVAIQGAYLVSMPLVIASLVLGPHITKYYEEGRLTLLSSVVRTVTSAVFVGSVLVFIPLLLWGFLFISWIFGAEFSGAYEPLIVLAVGQLISSLAGPVGLLLSMTRFEKDTLVAVFFGAVVNVITNFLLIPRFGMLGASFGTMIGIILSNILLCLFVYKKMQIVPGPALRHFQIRETL